MNNVILCLHNLQSYSPIQHVSSRIYNNHNNNNNNNSNN
jgi:hypothetical protein